MQYSIVFTANSLNARVGENGVILGSVEIVDCVLNHPSIWAEVGTYNWVLANPIKFEMPIPAKGQLGFWEFNEISYFENK